MIKKCKVKICKNIHDTNGKTLKRTRFDPNKIICKGKVCEIILYDIKCNEKAKTIIDNNEKILKNVKKYKWYLFTKGYVGRKNLGKRNLHHLILSPKKGFITDHINTNKLDNRKSNLRYATHQENSRNRKNVKGYSWEKNKKIWRARITVNYKIIWLGRFKNEKDAIKARRQAEIKYFGKFRYKNKK